MFDVGVWEILVIVVVGIVVFGPDRLPDYARQAGRMVRQVRKFAKSAESDLRNELGPEFADLKISDLNPRNLIQKHVLDAADDDLVTPAEKPTATPTAVEVLAAGEAPPYDPEST